MSSGCLVLVPGPGGGFNAPPGCAKRGEGILRRVLSSLRRGRHGGGSRIRTGDFLLAKQALYRLSYAPVGLPAAAGAAANAGGPDKSRTCDLVLIRDAL